MSWKFGLFSALVVVLTATQTRASIDLDNPITLSTAGVVGIRSALQADGGEDELARLGYAQTILNLVQGGVLNELDPEVNGQGWEYQANPDIDYSGTIISSDPTVTSFTINTDGQIVIPAGYAYVLVKYDGDKAGYVLYATGGGASELPQSPYSIWGKNDTQYAISGWTGYNVLTPNPGSEVPEPASVAVWALLSLCCGGFVSKMRRRQK